MKNHTSTRRQYIRHVHEILFAINIACALVFFAFATSEAYIPFAHLEVRTNKLLGIRQTDFIRGHFQFWIPALGLALCFWLLLRICSHAKLTNQMLRFFAGLVAFFLLPAVWIYSDPRGGWFFRGLLELAVIVVAFFLVLFRSRYISTGMGYAIAATHYLFWYWLFNGFHLPNWEAPGYFGPAGPILALWASLTWVSYVNTISLGNNAGTNNADKIMRDRLN